MNLRDQLKSMMVPEPLAPGDQSYEVCAQRLRLTLQLCDAGIEMMRQNLKRRDPQASEETIEARLTAWLRTRPGAEHGDGEGVPRPCL